MQAARSCKGSISESQVERRKQGRAEESEPETETLVRHLSLRASGLFPPPLWERVGVGGHNSLGSLALTPPTSALSHEGRGDWGRQFVYSWLVPLGYKALANGSIETQSTAAKAHGRLQIAAHHVVVFLLSLEQVQEARVPCLVETQFVLVNASCPWQDVLLVILHCLAIVAVFLVGPPHFADDLLLASLQFDEDLGYGDLRPCDVALVAIEYRQRHQGAEAP